MYHAYLQPLPLMPHSAFYIPLPPTFYLPSHHLQPQSIPLHRYYHTKNGKKERQTMLNTLPKKITAAAAAAAANDKDKEQPPFLPRSHKLKAIRSLPQKNSCVVCFFFSFSPVLGSPGRV